LSKYLLDNFGLDLKKQGIEAEKLDRHELGDAIFDKLREIYEDKEKQLGPDGMRYHERMIMLSVLDTQWKDHLLNMDHLKEGIGLRGYAQRDPLVEYKRESFDMFEAMMQRFQEDTVRYLYLMQIVEEPSVENIAAAKAQDEQRKRARATSLDEMEKEFQRKKRRELEQASMAGA